jgi:hypothetical protein
MKYRLLWIFVVACAKQPPAAKEHASVASASPQPNFELDCGATDTASATQLHCVRTDTRTGELLVVDYMRLPVSNGPTGTGTTAPGRFTTACQATATNDRADFYCIRMNTDSGELLLVNLTKVGTLPPKS